MTTTLIVAPSTALLPAPLFVPTPRAERRFVEFFTIGGDAVYPKRVVADPGPDAGRGGPALNHPMVLGCPQVASRFLGQRDL
jgi:hypothetical protein